MISFLSKNTFCLLLILISSYVKAVPIAGGTYTIGPTGTYATLTAVASALNTNGVGGAVIFEFQTTYTDAGETYPITFNQITGASVTNTITVRPTTGATGIVLDGSTTTTPLIDLSGTDYITFDGQPGGAGGTKELTLFNTNNTATGGAAIRFISDATNNTVKYTKLKALTINAAVTVSGCGIIFFSTATTTGNDNNTITY